MTKVAVIQLCSSHLIDKNLAQIETLVTQAKNKGAKLILLPENCAFMGLHENDKLTVAEAFGNGVIQNCLAKLAQQHELWIIAGTIPIKTDKRKVYASSLVFDDKGIIVARYDKIHLFDVRVSADEAHQESAIVQAGSEVVVIKTPVGRVGLSVCYDLRFPELYRQLLAKQAELFVVPSAFTQITGAAHWEILLRTRAIENLSYVLAANQGGTHSSGRQTYGHSMIIDYWGRICSQMEQTPGYIIAEIDLQQQQKQRELFPAVRHISVTNENATF